MLISQKDYAKKKGWSPSYVNKIIKQGKIPSRNGKVDPVAADAALGSTQSSGSMTYLQARTIREQIKAKLDNLEYQKLTGKLVESEKVKEAAENAFKNVRDRLLMLPRSLSAVLATTSKAAEAEQVLTDAIYNALQGLSTDIFMRGEDDGRK